MAHLNYKTLSFSLEKDNLRINLLRIFYCKVPIIELKKIGFLKLIDENTIEFDNNKAETKFSFLLNKYFQDLKNSINNNKTVYIHQNSGIPLIGHVSFGIVYRTSSLIEIKPVTSCNLNCIYCSVSEGKASDKVDFVVEKDYLIQELQELLNFVEEPVEVHIGVQGEPFLYADLVDLIKDLQNNKQITVVSMDTNFTLVTKSVIDQLAKFDKLRFNVSLDSMEEDLAEKMAGSKYNLSYVLDMIKYAVKKKVKVLIAPVLVPGYNEKEMEKIVNFVKELGIKSAEKHPNLGIQNFLNYKTGRNPTRAWQWTQFYKYIKELEQKTTTSLKLTQEKFGIHKTKALPKPFQEEDVVNATLKCSDRFKGSSIAVAKGRIISVPSVEFIKEKQVQLRILRDKHNIFTGRLV
ncbi:hypothetical protein COY27_05305 [Candidatus Woesearchaeota archaeon CG_4_10_14_0_2_um_filter_33_13]|nr:MAG: hypothetical protein COY27_05305 [Candidatus Woesearchaeota archaeon CG_4_10_14_0_2_um_filter_33_13]